MASLKQRATRVVYVAASARELPAEVQEWLSQADNRAIASPHIYDALALLAMGRKPAAIIVSIHSVDWSEMEFFNQATRLSPETRIYVAGHDHHQDKLEEACQRGAEYFDPNLLTSFLAGGGRSDGYLTDWSLTDEAKRPAIIPAISGIAAAKTPMAPAAEAIAADADIATPGPTADEPPASPEAAPSDGTLASFDKPRETEREEPTQNVYPNHRESSSSQGQDLLAGSFRAVASWPEQRSDAQQSPAAFYAASPSPVSKPSPLPAEARATEDAGATDEATDRPQFRLVSADEQETEGEAPAVAFPWSPSPDRPRRTPPSQAALEQGPSDSVVPQNISDATETEETDIHSVRLTPEELAALIGRPPEPNTGATKEHYS